MRPEHAPSAPVHDIALWLAFMLAASAPALLAYNVPPSATFLNQALAIIGWGVVAVLLANQVNAGVPLRRLAPLLASLVLLALAALGSWWWGTLPYGLSCSAVGLVLTAGVIAAAGATARASPQRERLFAAFCYGWVIAGALSLVIGWIQVFSPNLADGEWIAASAADGRASGNLRQPNHLSSLLLWSLIAVAWLADSGRLRRGAGASLMVLFIFGVVLSASRTGTIGVVMLALWGALDRRLSRPVRLMLFLSPVIYALCWTGLTFWAHESHQVFGGERRFTADGDISSSRFAIWSNTLALIAQHPWLGVGFGEFNFAWSLTPFPHRPIAFFDHTHNLPLQFAVELGLPLAALVLALLLYALWRAFDACRRADARSAPMLRAAFMMVLMMAVHSQLEYPLWYAYFLLPTAFAFGFCLGADNGGPGDRALAGKDAGGVAAARSGPMLLVASMLVMAGGGAALYDYAKVVVIFSPPDDAPPLEQRIAEGRRSWFFAHHADYAAATTAAHPSEVMPSFADATHYLLDTRLMTAWARAYEEAGDTERARHLAQRLKEFRNEESAAFFEPCRQTPPRGESLPFQCLAPTRPMDYRDFE